MEDGRHTWNHDLEPLVAWLSRHSLEPSTPELVTFRTGIRRIAPELEPERLVRTLRTFLRGAIIHRNRDEGQVLIRRDFTWFLYRPALFSSGHKAIDDFDFQNSRSLSTRQEPAVPLYLPGQLARFQFLAHYSGDVAQAYAPFLDPPRERYSTRLKGDPS